MSETKKTTKHIKTGKGNTRKRSPLTNKRAGSEAWFITLMITFAGLILTTALTLCLGSLLQVRVLTCTRLESTQYNCLLQSNLLGLIPLHTMPISGLRGATVKHEIVESTSEDSNGRSHTSRSTVYWVVLATSRGDVELDIVRDGWSGSKLDTAERINAFVRDPAMKSLQVHGALMHLLWAPLILFFLIIALFLLIAGVKELAADVRDRLRRGYSVQSI